MQEDRSELNSESCWIASSRCFGAILLALEAFAAAPAKSSSWAERDSRTPAKYWPLSFETRYSVECFSFLWSLLPGKVVLEAFLWVLGFGLCRWAGVIMVSGIEE